MFDVNFIPAGTGVNINVVEPEFGNTEPQHVLGKCDCGACAYVEAISTDHYFTEFNPF